METINKHKTNIISKLLLVTVIIIAGMLITTHNKSYANECTVDNIVYDYELDGSGNATNVTIKSDGSTPRNVIYIPDTLDGHTVTSLGKGESFVTGGNSDYVLTIGASVEDVGTMSEEFINGTNRTPRFVIPQHVTKVNDNAFKNMVVDKTNIENLQYIGDHAFDSTIILGTMYTPWVLNLSNVQHLGDYAFSIGVANSPVTLNDFSNQMNSYTEVTFGSNLTEIGKGAFKGYRRLRKVTIPSNITAIGERAFEDCIALDHLAVDTRSGNLSFGDYSFANTAIQSVTVPAIWTLGTGVFADCKSLTTATIEAGHTEIPDNTFGGSGLEQITIPSGLTTIGDAAFAKTKLDTDDYNYIMGNNITSVGDSAFAETPLTGTVVVPNTVTSFGEYVFSGCDQIETGTISISNLEKLPNGTYKGCKSLTTVNLPASVVEIGNSAFEDCSALSMSMLNSNILDSSKPSMAIGDKAFKNCDGLAGAFTLPTNVTAIGEEAFYGCDGLTGTLTINNNNIQTIKRAAFKDCGNVENIVISGTNLTTIEGQAFNGTAVDQQIINIQAGVTSIGGSAFTKPSEIFLRGTQENDFVGEYRWYGSGNPIIHFAGEKHTIEFRNYIPGVTVTNAATDASVGNDTVEVACDSNYTFKVNKGSYEGTVFVKVLSEAPKKGDEMVEEFVELDANNSYSFNNLTRDKIVILQRLEEGTDLVLRTFITGINERNMTSRTPKTVKSYEGGLVSFDYNHTKQPLYVKKGQKITYTIRAYNQGKEAGEVNAIKVRLPSQLKLAENNEINNTFGWTVSNEGSEARTTYMAEKSIPALTRSGRPQYEDVKIVCEVKEASQNEQYITLLAEIADGNDNNSVPNDSDSVDLATYKIDESLASDRDVYVKDDEDDMDYETVVMAGQVKGDFNLVVTKLDKKTTQLLDGAKVRLYDENMNEIRTVTTVDGQANFGSFSTYGEGVDTYYLEEVESPVGYKRTVNGKVELKIVKELVAGELEITILCDTNEILDPAYNSNVDYIPISTAEQLSKMGSGEEITIGNKTYTFDMNASYQLQNDIDLSGMAWKPINKVVGIFDGNNKKITNMTISDATTYQMVRGVGMFVKFEGTIKDLELNVSVADTLPTAPTQNDNFMGGLVAFMGEGRISNCKVNFTTSQGYGGNESVGGMIGKITTSATVAIENSSAVITRNDTATQNIGGFVGSVNGNLRISNCSNAGSNLGTNGLTGIGGYVGFSSTGSYVQVEDCVNKISGLSGNENVGGIIGTSRGGLTLRRCTNEQDITAKENSDGVSIGGLVGYAEPSSYTPRNLSVVYDNGTVNVYMENTEKVDTFKFNIWKVNLQHGNPIKLDGAKFTVYKKDGDDLTPIAENVETEDGVISIGNIEMSSETNDVYYIKETQAPAGYDLIVTDYIKVLVTAGWDGVNERYVINPELSIVEDIETDTVDPVDGIKGDRTGLHTSTVNVKWKTNKVLIEESTNKASVTGNKNVGGLIGTSKGFVIVNGSSNALESGATDKITASVMNAGGIIGCASASENDHKIDVESCSNTMPVEAGQDAGGIVGASHAKVELVDDSNTGNITATECSAGGILGVFYNDTIIDGCSNKNNEITAGQAGGIVGTLGDDTIKIDDNNVQIRDYLGFPINATSLKIYDCTTENCTIEASSYCAGGIIGANSTMEDIIEGCTVKNSTVNASHSAAGIQGFNGGEEFIANDNNVINTQIKSSYCAAGVLSSRQSGSFSSSYIHYGAELSNVNSYVNNCHIYGGSIESPCVAGIMQYAFIKTNAVIEITDCTVEKAENNEKATLKSIKENSNNAHAGGILGNVDCESSGEYSIRVKLDNNIVSDAVITAPNTARCGGIAAYMDTNAVIQAFEVEITNCKVKDSELNGDYGCGGIIDGIYMGTPEAVKTTVENCEVNNVNAISRGHVAGIIGSTWINSHDINISAVNCHVVDFSSTGAVTVGGIYGDLYWDTYDTSKMIIDKCTVEHITANNTSKHVGGLFGYLYNQYKGDLYITDSKCIGKRTTSGVQPSTVNSGKGVGGILGGQFSSDDNTTYITNVECSDFTVNEPANQVDIVKSEFVGGIIGDDSYTEDHILDGLTAKNITINVKFDETPGGYPSYGGIAAAIGDIDCSNINIDNITVDVSAGKAAAGFANVTGAFRVNDVNISNSTVSIDDSGIPFQNEIGGLIAGNCNAQGGESIEEWIKNVKIDYVELSAAKSSHSALIAAEVDRSRETAFLVDNIDIKNSSINIDRSADYYQETLGGIIGNNRGLNSTIRNIKMKNVELIQDAAAEDTGLIGHAGGIVGHAYDSSNYENITIDGLKVVNNSEYVPGYESTPSTGGIVGVIAKDYKDSKFKNIEVKNIEVTGTRSVGGILGDGIATMDGVTVINPKITANGNLARAGGIAGIVFNNSTLKDVTVKVDDTDTSKTYGVFSDNLAGGIAGICVGIMDGADVKDITVKTADNFVPVPGEQSSVEEVSDEGHTAGIANANSNAARLAGSLINCVVSNVKLIIGTQTQTVNE